MYSYKELKCHAIMTAMLDDYNDKFENVNQPEVASSVCKVRETSL